MIQGIFFDVGGTMVSFRQKFVSDRLLADLAALRERGIKLFLSTGRALQDLENTGMLRGARFDGFVTLGGQYCCDGAGVPFRDAPIARSDLRGAYEVFKAHPELPAVMEGNGESYLTTINDRVRQVYEFLHTQLYPVRDPAWLLEGKVYQLAPFVTPEEEGVFLSAMPGCKSTRWHTEGIDILPRDGGKGAGVRAAMERYGLAREEIMAFGDGENDMTMLAEAGVSVAMGNGDQAVRDMADYVTAAVEEDGISQALRRFGLLPG